MATEQIALSWGRCEVYFKKASEDTYKKMPTPVEDSTQLTPSTQDAMEAPVEGGELEARKAKANKYELVTQVRIGGSRDEIIPHVNGVVNDEYSVAVVPEDTNAKGILMERVSAYVLDNTFNADAGIVDEFHFDGLKPESGNIVKRGKIAVTGTADAYTLTLEGQEA